MNLSYQFQVLYIANIFKDKYLKGFPSNIVSVACTLMLTIENYLERQCEPLRRKTIVLA